MTTWAELGNIIPALREFLAEEQRREDEKLIAAKRANEIEWKAGYWKWLSRRTPTVRARLMKANPSGVNYFEMPKGWHPKPTARRMIHIDVMSKRSFLDQFGREAWENLPAYAFYKSGRRKYVTYHAVMSRAWETGGAMPMQQGMAA